MEFPYVGFSGETVDLFLVNSEKYQKTTLRVLSTLCSEKGMSCIYVSANRPKTNLDAILSARGIDPDEIFFVDCVSRLVGNNGTGVNDTDNCIYVSTPGNLTEISIAITKALNHMKSGTTFVLVDSLSTLEVYSTTAPLARFVHTLITKMRNHDVGGIFLLLDGEQDKKLLGTLSQYCDRVVATSGGIMNQDAFAGLQIEQETL